jgi:hypothetical protein
MENVMGSPPPYFRIRRGTGRFAIYTARNSSRSVDERRGHTGVTERPAEPTTT